MTKSIPLALKAGLVLAAGLTLTVPVSALAGGYSDYSYRDGYYSCHERKADNATGGAVAGVIIGGAAGGVPGAIVGGAVVGSAAAGATRCYRSNSYAYDDSGYISPTYRDGYYSDDSYNGDRDSYRRGYEDGYRDRRDRRDGYTYGDRW